MDDPPNRKRSRLRCNGSEALPTDSRAMPPAVTVEMAKGFTLFMVKVVLHGRTADLVDLAVTNLER